MCTSSDIGSDGGALELTAPDGTECRLTIPEGQLSATTKITVTAVASSRGSSLGALSNDFLVEPEGLEFDAPVNIEITLANPVSADRAPAILHTAADGPGVVLDTQVDGQTLSASLTHFSYLSPVAPTAAELQLYWDSIALEIDTYGLNVERVRTLASIYLHAQADSEVYGAINLPEWEDELWAQTNDLVILGTLRCTSGNPAEGAYILSAAVNISSIMFFTDLETDAQEALASCIPSGAIEASMMIGTASGWLRAVYDDYNNPMEDWIWPTYGNTLNSTEPCEYDGGHSSLGGGITLSGEASMENQLMRITLEAAGGGSSGNVVTLTFQAYATAAPDMAPGGAVLGRAQGSFKIDPEQAVLIIENNGSSPIDLDLVWTATAHTEITGGGDSEATSSVSYSFHIGGSLTGSGEARSDKGGDHQSGSFSGSEVISIDPGKHCLDLSASIIADVRVPWTDLVTSSSGTASLSLVVSVAIP